MKKKIQALCASLFMGILLFMAGVQTFAEPSYTSKFSDWGNLLKQYANVEDEEETIYARGKNGVITNKEVEQAIAFYDTFGMSAEEAGNRQFYMLRNGRHYISRQLKLDIP